MSFAFMRSGGGAMPRARRRGAAPSPRLRGEGWGEGPGEFAPRPSPARLTPSRPLPALRGEVEPLAILPWSSFRPLRLPAGIIRGRHRAARSRAPGGRAIERLAADAELLDQRAVARLVLALDVVEERAALGDHLQEATPGMVVLGVGLEVLGQVVDAFGQDCDLDLGRPGVAGLCPCSLMSAVLRSAVIDIVLPFWLASKEAGPAGRRPLKAAGPGCRPARSREMRRAGKSRRETRRLYTKAAGKPVESQAIRPRQTGNLCRAGPVDRVTHSSTGRTPWPCPRLSPISAPAEKRRCRPSSSPG